MSETERNFLDKFATLPKGVQDRVLDRIDGAAMAVDALRSNGSAIGPEEQPSGSSPEE